MSDTSHAITTCGRGRVPRRVFAGVLLLLGCGAATGAMAQVRTGVQAKHGEMVLIRNVHTRPADRAGTPGMAMIIDPTPRKQLLGALNQNGSHELTDAEYAALGSGLVGHSLRPDGTQAPASNLIETRNGVVHGNVPPPASASGISPLGTVGASARAMGDTVRNTLQMLPGMTGTGGGGH